LLEAKAFHPTRTARNHLRILAVAGNINDARVDEVLDIVGLKDLARKKPGKFSLGMSQRLGIAAAILGEPKYLLLDEPANGLDPEGIAWLRQFIKAYADKGNAVLVSSHLLSEMSQMADNIIVIGKGRMIADTTVKHLLSGSTQSGVFIRTSSMSKLERILKSDEVLYKKENGGLLVTGLNTDKLGQLAYEGNIPVLELTTRMASLEDAFLELTADVQVYQAK
jgi:ABC-2 type transport system ATP-binding protein